MTGAAAELDLALEYTEQILAILSTMSETIDVAAFIVEGTGPDPIEDEFSILSDAMVKGMYTLGQLQGLLERPGFPNGCHEPPGP